MLTISPLSSTPTTSKDGNNKGGGMDPNFSIRTEDYPDFSGSNLLDSIDFDDLFMGMHDVDILPDLEMDPDLLAEFSLSSYSGVEDESSDANNNNSSSANDCNDGYILDVANYEANENGNYDFLLEKKEDIKASKKMREEEEIVSKKDVKVESETSMNLSSKESGEKGKKSSSNSKNIINTNNNNQAKRKTKVDWTPELHRRFVQAVEQLGVDKAVPSRILELMGIDCLTRHNIASHLQKYRSHRKHLLAREAEAANWTQKRHMYGVTMGGVKGGGVNVSPWYPPIMGFPPMTTMHPPPFRPLHVWGHPTMDPQSRLPLWPKQVVPSAATPPLPPGWAPPPPHHPPADPSFWHSSHHQRRLGVAPVPGIPPHTMFRSDQHGPNPHPPPQSSGSHPPLDLHPSKESIDAAIGDVLAKPWKPLPLGLKPPSMDSVMVELQRQGVPNIPPSCA